MECRFHFNFFNLLLDLSPEEFQKHLEECAGCRRTLDNAYQEYRKNKPNPSHKSYPPYSPEKSKDEFLRDWMISLAAHEEKRERNAASLRQKLEDSGVQEIFLALMRKLIEITTDTNSPKKENLRHYVTIAEVLFLLEKELNETEFKLLTGGKSREEIEEKLREALEIETTVNVKNITPD